MGALTGLAACRLPAAVLTAVLLCLPLVERPAFGQEGPDVSSEAIRQQITESEKELDRLREELNQRRKQASELAGREYDLLGEIERINEEIDVNRQLLVKLAERKEILLADLMVAQGDLAVAEARFEAARNMLGKRLRAIYKFGRGENMEIVLLSKSFADLTKRVYYLSVIAAHDRELMSVFEERVETRRVLMEHIEGKKAKIEAVAAEVVEETHNLQLKKEQRDALVAEVKEKRYYYENLAQKLEEASSNLERLIGELEAKRGGTEPGGKSFEGRMGKLAWPCEGQVTSEFGVQTHPRFGTIIRNNGIDIKTSPGTKIRAVANGQVSFAGALSGFGNCIIVNHGDGFYTLYGRLESLIVGNGYDVREGDALGLVGDSSTPEGAVLHFEIRYGKRALDPVEWLSR